MVVKTFTCPTRHGNSFLSSGGARSGPMGDYAAPMCRATGYRDWWHYYCIYNTNFIDSDIKGPFIRPTLEFLTTQTPITGDPANLVDLVTPHVINISNWTFQTTFGRWGDGTSNQIAIVEKQIPIWALDGNDTNSSYWNGMWFFTYTKDNASNTARLVCWTTNSANTTCYENIARGLNFPETPQSPQANEGANKLGSAHPGVFNVLVGDGSVRPINVTTPPRITWSLTCIDDALGLPFP